MKRWIMGVAGLSIAAASIAAPQPAMQGVEPPERLSLAAIEEALQSDAMATRPAIDADGCVSTTMSCNSIATGRLGSGDCTLDGKYEDFLKFQGRAGDYVEATIRPLSPSLTSPLIGFLPPAGDASRTPFIFGGRGGATAGFVLSTSGTWSVIAGTNDLFGSGEYAVSLECGPDPEPNEPHNCFAQPLLCNQTGEWYLTNESCRWDDGSGVYDDFVIDAVTGDVLNVDMTAVGFTPLFGIYAENGTRLASSTLSGGHAKASVFVGVPGPYHVLVTANERQATGRFDVTVSCGLSGCLAPIILNQPAAEVTVPFGQRATLSGSANAPAGNLQFEWFNADDIPTSTGHGATFQTPPVTSKQTYYYVASTQCGQASSRLITVTPSSGRRRSVRH